MKLKNVYMGEKSGRWSGRVRFFVGNRDNVGKCQRFAGSGRLGSGPRKVTRGQLCGPVGVQEAPLNGNCGSKGAKSDIY